MRFHGFEDLPAEDAGPAELSGTGARALEGFGSGEVETYEDALGVTHIRTFLNGDAAGELWEEVSWGESGYPLELIYDETSDETLNIRKDVGTDEKGGA